VIMSNPNQIELQYQLRKCLLTLNKAYIAAFRCNEHHVMKETRKCINLIKKQMNNLSAEKTK